MELRHLRYFAVVAETCHFGRAAERLRLAQPALSHAVRQLEAELGTPLLNRTTRQVSLTPAGEFLLSETRSLLARVDAATRSVRRIADGQVGLLRIGLTGTASFSHLPAIVRTIKRDLPGVALEIRSDLLTPAQCDAIRDGVLDLGVLRPPAVGDGVDLLTIATEPLVLAVPSDHDLAGAAAVSVRDLADEPFVVYGAPDSAVNDAVMRACRAVGFVPRREHEAPGTVVVLAFVAAGLGVALVPASVRALPLGGVVLRDVPDAGSVELALAWKRGLDNPVLTAAVTALETELLATSHPEAR